MSSMQPAPQSPTRPISNPSYTPQVISHHPEQMTTDPNTRSLHVPQPGVQPEQSATVYVAWPSGPQSQAIEQNTHRFQTPLEASSGNAIIAPQAHMPMNEQPAPISNIEPSQRAISMAPREIARWGTTENEVRRRQGTRVVEARGVIGARKFDADNLLGFPAREADKKKPCAICLGLLEEEDVSCGQCLHLMHTSCLKTWLRKDVLSACPVCREPFCDSD